MSRTAQLRMFPDDLSPSKLNPDLQSEHGFNSMAQMVRRTSSLQFEPSRLIGMCHVGASSDAVDVDACSQTSDDLCTPSNSASTPINTEPSVLSSPSPVFSRQRSSSMSAGSQRPRSPLVKSRDL